MEEKSEAGDVGKGSGKKWNGTGRGLDLKEKDKE